MGAAARWAWGTPGQPQGQHACQRALYNHRGAQGSRASLILFSLDCSGGLVTFFLHSSIRGKQWECPGLAGGVALPAQHSFQHSNSGFKHCSHRCHHRQQVCAHFQPLPGCQPRGGTPSPCPLSNPTCSAFQGFGHGDLPLPPLPLGVQIPTAAAGAPGEAVPWSPGTQQVLPPWGRPSVCGGSTGHGKENTGHFGSVELGLA